MAHVDDFWRAGTEAGYRDDGAPGWRPQYREDYYGSFLLDPDGNSVEAVHHGAMRGGGIDHLWIRVADVAAAKTFYELVAPFAGFRLKDDTPTRVRFVGGSGSFSLVEGTPTRPFHLAFAADDDETVDAFHRDVTAAGYRDNGGPGERPRVPRGLLRRVRARPRRPQRRDRESQPLNQLRKSRLCSRGSATREDP